MNLGPPARKLARFAVGSADTVDACGTVIARDLGSGARRGNRAAGPGAPAAAQGAAGPARGTGSSGAVDAWPAQ